MESGKHWAISVSGGNMEQGNVLTFTVERVEDGFELVIDGKIYVCAWLSQVLTRIKSRIKEERHDRSATMG